MVSAKDNSQCVEFCSRERFAGTFEKRALVYRSQWGTVMILRILVAGIINALTLFTLTMNCSADVLSGMTAYWRFNESGGLIAGDSVGTNNAVLMGNAALVNDSANAVRYFRSTAASRPTLYSIQPSYVKRWYDLGLGQAGCRRLNRHPPVFPGQGVSGSNRIYIYSSSGDLKIGMGNLSSIGSNSVHLDSNWHQIALAWSGPGNGNGSFSAYFDAPKFKPALMQGSQRQLGGFHWVRIMTQMKSRLNRATGWAASMKRECGIAA